MSIINKTMTIALGIVLVVAIVLPFLNLGIVSNTTAEPTRFGLPSSAWNAIFLVILVVFVFLIIRRGTKYSGVWHH